ncbi:MAG: hypothetical protein H6988_10980 [Pseudomonadales bacterium]|nr:hypothetical protein [Pseudomonadales bacterium]
MELLISLVILFVVFIAIVYLLTGLLFFSQDYRPSQSGFLRVLLAAMGLAGLFGGNDDNG